MTSMNAAVLVGPGQALVQRSIPRPQAGPGEVLVKVAACGFCHTDLHYLDHGVPTSKAPPIVLGHEISGTVAALGAGVTGVQERASVLLPAVIPCGQCRPCRTGRENICQNMRMFGNHVDGGFAEFVVCPAKDLIPLPKGVPLEEGCVIADALSTPYHAVVNRARVRAGEWTVVVGCGGVGINVVQMAALAGAQVVAVDLRADKLALARGLGAVETINASEVRDAAKEVRRITGGGADVAFEVVGTPGTFATAHGSIRRGGRVCLVGYSSAPAELPSSKIMFLEQEIIGSLGCPPSDYPRIVELVRTGRLRLDPVVTGRLPLERVNEAAAALREGKGLRTIILP